jgi:hypothetical protein
VQEVAQTLGIELLSLPTYAPHLTLIERFWKFVKKQCLYAKSYENFPELQEAISQCIAKAPTEHKAELDSFVSKKSRHTTISLTASLLIAAVTPLPSFPKTSSEPPKTQR